MPQVTGSASSVSATFRVGLAQAQFINGDTHATVNYATSGNVSPDEARLRASDLETAADIATMLDGALQDGDILYAFAAVCELNGWGVDIMQGAIRIHEGTEL